MHDRARACAVQAFLQRGGGRLTHLATSLFHTVDTNLQGILSLQARPCMAFCARSGVQNLWTKSPCQVYMARLPGSQLGSNE